MQKQVAPHRVRAARRGSGLYQKDLARLVGYNFPIQVSRAERNLREPSLRFVIGSSILFGRSIEDLFKALYDSVEEHLVREAYILHERLASDDTPAAHKIRDLLASVISAAAKRQA